MRAGLMIAAYLVRAGIAPNTTAALKVREQQREDQLLTTTAITGAIACRRERVHANSSTIALIRFITSPTLVNTSHFLVLTSHTLTSSASSSSLHTADVRRCAHS